MIKILIRILAGITALLLWVLVVSTLGSIVLLGQGAQWVADNVFAPVFDKLEEIAE